MTTTVKLKCPRCGNHDVPFPFPNNADNYLYRSRGDDGKTVKRCIISLDDFNVLDFPISARKAAEYLCFYPETQIGVLLRTALRDMARRNDNVELVSFK